MSLIRTMTPMNIHSEERVMKKCIEDGLKILQHYSWLLDSFVLDFYTDKHWDKLPCKWKNILDNVELDELGFLIDYRHTDSSLRRVWPLSLLALRSASQKLSLSREPVNCLSSTSLRISNKINEGIVKESEEQNKGSGIALTSMDFDCKEIFENEILVNPQFSHVFMKHVKPKKRHEIALMAQITAATATSSNCKYVVDIGSGLGHLARTLSYGYGLHVCCLEAQDSLAYQARKLDTELEVTIKKYVSNKSILKLCRPVHLNRTLDSSLDENDFVEALQTAFGIEDKHFNFGIVGLHPCGDLGPILLKLLTKCSNAKFINIVGCCYMKLSTTEKSNSLEFNGYPLSNFVANQPHVLSYEAREIACHAIENYSERLCSGDASHLKIHCYRATLERIIMKYWPNLRHSGIRSIRHASSLPFDKYCQVATERLGILLPDAEINSKETEEDLSQWKRVVIFYSLRLLLAPLVEAVLLWDRLCYLLELGLNGMLLPVFDPTLSPRNHILIATKQCDKR